MFRIRLQFINNSCLKLLLCNCDKKVVVLSFVHVFAARYRKQTVFLNFFNTF